VWKTERRWRRQNSSRIARYRPTSACSRQTTRDARGLPLTRRVNCPEPSCRQAITMLARPSCRERADRVHVSHVSALQSLSDRSCRIQAKFSPSGATQRHTHNYRNLGFGPGYEATRARISMVHTSGTTGEHSHRMLKKTTFSPAQPRRAKTRRSTGKAVASNQRWFFQACSCTLPRMARMSPPLRAFFQFPQYLFKGSLVDPRLRASNEHILIVRVPRAGGRLGCPYHLS
jgi:hypothetical protein